MESVEADEKQVCETHEENVTAEKLNANNESDVSCSTGGKEQIEEKAEQNAGEKMEDCVSVSTTVEEHNTSGGDGKNDVFHTPEATDTESMLDKCDVEPMDIDEILNSVQVDPNCIGSGDEFCDAQSTADTEEQIPQNHETSVNGPQIKTMEQVLSSVNQVPRILAQEEIAGVSGDIQPTAQDGVESTENLVNAGDQKLNGSEQNFGHVDSETENLEKNADVESKAGTVDEVHENIEIDLDALIDGNEALFDGTESSQNQVNEVVAVGINEQVGDFVAVAEKNHENRLENEFEAKELDNILEFLDENEEIFCGADANTTSSNDVKCDDVEMEDKSDVTSNEAIEKVAENIENKELERKLDVEDILTVTETVEETLEKNVESMSVDAEVSESEKKSEKEQEVKEEKEPESNVEEEEQSELSPKSEENLKENSPKGEDQPESNEEEKLAPKEEPFNLKAKEEFEIKPPVRGECLNIECSKRSEIFYAAPEFVINHYHLNKRSKMMLICDECFDTVTESYGELCAALLDKQPLFLNHIKYSDLVEIIDSSDEDEDDDVPKTENSQTLDVETLSLIENELEAVIKETLEKVDIKQQMDWNRQIINAKVDNNEKNCTEMMQEMRSLQTQMDKLYTDTYNLKNTFIEEIQSLDLDTLKPTQIYSENYPPLGELKYPEIQYNTIYYTFRTKLTSRWIPCKVIEKIETNERTEYKVKFFRERKDGVNVKTVLRKHLAYGRVPEYRLNIGTRVIALFDDSSDNSRDKSVVIKNNFSPGVIAEPISLYTHWRYLVFFDDGWVQYVHHENIRVVCEATENVWELIEEPGAKTFIEGYVKEFKKKRPIVQVRPGQRVQTELNGRWYNAIVIKVDSSLVQVFFEETKRYEWIYRGSTRLLPLYKKHKHITMPTTNRNEATIEYIVIDDDKEPERSTEPPVEEQIQPNTPSKTAPIQRTFASQAARDTPQQKQREQKRAVAKKSTVPQPKPAIQHMNNSTIYVDEDKPKGKVVYYTAKKHINVKKYINHGCKPNCLVEVQHNLSTYSPLSKPLLSGFERQIAKTRFNKKFVAYRAPCGRRLRDMSEMHKYLRLTNCKLNVDNFTFDPLIHCLAEYVIDSYVMRKPDLSDGIEKMPVQLVNCYDNSMPPPCTYSAKRIPTDGVDLNCDSEFLCGCDCTDDCLDKSKCACWKLTLQGAKYGNPDMQLEDVGYQYKRLNEPVPTGIYECNSRCKCKSNCLNRVVQHPLQLKLQVFKTVNRGWGLRCLNDVPKGSFICCYAGNLLTETSANEAGGDLGDEYFAELDYIEVVENMKEGYEPDVIENESSASEDEDFDVEMESLRTRNDDSDDEFVARTYTASEDSESRRYSTRNSVDKRKKSEQSAAKSSEKRKERTSSSDDDGDDTRQVKNFMASNTMPLNNEPEDKSIRNFFGKDESVYIMDAKKAGNIGRYFNHSCGPNLFVQNVFVDTHDLRFPWVAFFASTHIRAGTELTWNYNYEVGSVPGKVLICQCGDEKCRGRIL